MNWLNLTDYNLKYEAALHHVKKPFKSHESHTNHCLMSMFWKIFQLNLKKKKVLVLCFNTLCLYDILFYKKTKRYWTI